MLWARLRAINARQHRGATPEEPVEIAKSSGYRDRRAWNQWTGWEKDGDGNRWVTTEGMNNLRHYYVKVGYVLPADSED